MIIHISRSYHGKSVSEITVLQQGCIYQGVNSSLVLSQHEPPFLSHMCVVVMLMKLHYSARGGSLHTLQA